MWYVSDEVAAQTQLNRPNDKTSEVKAGCTILTMVYTMNYFQAGTWLLPTN